MFVSSLTASTRAPPRPDSASSQDLVVVTRTEQGLEQRVETPVRFVPMTGKAEQ